MSKIVNEYKRLKSKDPNTMYLFKIGKFYVFLGEDANHINDYMVLKKTKFSNEYDKCGFPVDSLDSYMRVIKNIGLKVKIIDEISEKTIADRLNSIDLDKITFGDAIRLLKTIKNYYETEKN